MAIGEHSPTQRKHPGPMRSLRRAAAVVFVGLALAACKVDLYTGLDERQSNEMVAVLMQHGIDADRVLTAGATTMTVQVDEHRFAEAVQLLKQAGLPRQEFATLGTVFAREGLVSSPMQERAQMIFALSQELSRTVSDIDGVVSARVHLVLPENDPLKQNLMPSSASIFIRHHADADIEKLVPQIKMLVANGVAGLSYDKVSTILVPVNNAIADTTGTETLGASTVAWSPFGGDGLIYGLVLLALIAAAVVGFLFWRRNSQRSYPLQTSTGPK
jgi:type III secretion protein J